MSSPSNTSDASWTPAVPRFIYWKFASRAQTPMLLLHAAGIPYDWDDATANAWPASKSSAPFGQLPILVDDGYTIAQSGTITRYCAKLGCLWPQNPAGWLKVDMLIEHCNDIYRMMEKAKYAGDDEAQWQAWQSFAKDKYPEKVAWIASMLGDNEWFGGEKMNAADVVVFSIFNLVERSGADCPLSNWPTLLEHSKRVAQVGTISQYLSANHPVYFKVPAWTAEQGTVV